MSLLSDMKRKIIGIIVLIVIFSVFGVLFIYDQPKSPEMREYERVVQEIFVDAKVQFENLRNVTLPSDVKLFVYTRQQVVDRWGEDFDDLSTASVVRQENVYKGLFLMAEEDSFRGAVAEWVSSWSAVTVGREIYVVYENFCPWDMPDAEAVLIHELTHVWQSDLLAFSNSYDMDRAYNALVEGDAVYMSDYYRSQYNNSVSIKGIEHKVIHVYPIVSWLGSVYPNVSIIASELNMFPYVEGKAFVSALFDRGGWSLVDSCYMQGYVPATTEQILHPSKYFSGETAKIIPTPTSIDNAWEVIPSKYGYSSDTFGEYFIYCMLDCWLNDKQAQNAAAGWGGDNFVYYEKEDDFLFVWNITWDSIQDASEFNQAFKDMLNLAKANAKGDNVWFSNGRYLALNWSSNTQITQIVCSTNQAVIDSCFFI